MSKKQSTAQIREHERSKLEKYFDNKYSYLIKEKDYYENLYKKEATELYKVKRVNKELRNRVDELEEKLHVYEDWTRRLQEFFDMPEDEGQEAFEQFISERRTNKKFDDLLSTYNELFKNLF